MKKKFNISSNLRQLRNSINITVTTLHKATGIDSNTLRKYETDYIMPSLENCVKICSYFGISLDFLFEWNNCNYIRCIKLLFLGKKIDSMDQNKRFHIETTARTLLGSKYINTVTHVKQDNITVDFTGNIHQNFKLIRDSKGVSQKEVASYINVLQNRIAFYEKNQTPKAETLIKLSKYFNVSIHSLATGLKLCFEFINGDLFKALLQADKLLSLEDKVILIEIMNRIIKDSK